MLRDARKKAYETNNHGVLKFIIFLIVCAAICGWGYVQYRAYQRQSSAVTPVAETTPVQPVSQPAKQESALAAADEVDTNPPAVQPPTGMEIEEEVVTVELEPRVDHLSLDWITPSNRDVLWQIGHLDGYPEKVEGPYSGEFGTKEASGTVIRIAFDRLQKDFPQRILPGQSIVIRFDEVIKEDLVFRGLSVGRDAFGTYSDPSQPAPVLRVLCNGQTIWGRQLARQSATIDALIPAAYLEDYQNTLTLQNTGKIPIVFDALWLEAAKPLQTKVAFHIRDFHQIPERYQPTFGWTRMGDDAPLPRNVPSVNNQLIQYATRTITEGVAKDQKLPIRHTGRWQYRNNFTALHQQEKVALYFLENTIGWYDNGGNALTLQNVTGPGRFFCQHTGMLYPSAHALWLVCKLFEGKSPRRLPINVLPASSEERPLKQVYWLATENQPGVVSILITRSRIGYIPGKKVCITCALPWKGTTKVSIYKGVFPEFVKMAKPTYRGVFRGDERIDDPNGAYDRNREQETKILRIGPNGKTGGLLELELDIQDCLLIRLHKEGTQDIPVPELPDEPVKAPELPPMVLAGNVTDAREDNLIRAKRLPVHFSMLQSICANYTVRIDEATRGNVQKQSYVVPQTTNSFYCSMDYTQTPQTTAEGAVLSLYPFHESIQQKTLSFWVYPHAEQKDPVELRLMLGRWHGRTFLKPNQWQRVELAFNDLAGEYERKLLLLGPRPHQRHTEKVTFEFNGFALLDTSEKTERYMSARQLSPKELAFVVLGQPGAPGLMRQSFSKPIVIQAVTRAVQQEPGKIHWAYNEHAQVLEVNGLQFPETTDPSVMSYLTPEEKELCSQSGLVPLVLIAETQI